MIHINIDGKRPSDEWCKKAEEITEKLKELNDHDERKKLIKKNSGMWKELKSWLTELSYNKCWYSEAKEIVSDYHVDHFRPKNRAKELDGTPREGYWWLAFDWSNYRIAGAICNSLHCSADGDTQGKADFFPLKDGSPVAISPTCNLEDEVIYFLDPTNPNDPSLLTFDESGYPQPAARKGTWEHERAKESIKHFHLDFFQLVDARKIICNNCKRSIDVAEKLISAKNKNPSADIDYALKCELMRLREMVSRETALSSTARAYLLSSGRSWARDLVSN